MMYRKAISVLAAAILYLSSFASIAFAQYDTSGYSTSGAQGGRYVLVTVKKPASYAGSYTIALRKKTPAVVLDTYLGIVWVSQDIKDPKLLWVKTDLGKNAGKEISRTKYVIDIPPFSGEDNKVPAVVLDTETGKTWVSSDIADPSSGWLETDLPKEVTREGYAPSPY